MTQPLVTVVTPCLNPGSRIQECLLVVQRQTYGNVEHVVVDGGSTDGTVDLLRRYPRVRWISEPDHGQVDAMNKGFRMAEGQIVTWLGADDLLTDRAVELACEAFLRNPGVDWVYGDTLVVGQGPDRLLRPPRELRKDSFDMGNVVAGVGVFMKARALTDIGGFDDSFQLSMDFDLWLRFLDAGYLSSYVPELFGIYRIHEASKTGKMDREAFLEEQFQSLRKNRRTTAAAMTLGRIVAWRSFVDGRIRSQSLREELEMASRRVEADLGTATEFRAVVAGARVEAALLETPHTIRGLRHLFSSAWLYSQTRRRILGALITGLKRMARGGLRAARIER